MPWRPLVPLPTAPHPHPLCRWGSPLPLHRPGAVALPRVKSFGGPSPGPTARECPGVCSVPRLMGVRRCLSTEEQWPGTDQLVGVSLAKSGFQLEGESIGPPKTGGGGWEAQLTEP